MSMRMKFSLMFIVIEFLFEITSQEFTSCTWEALKPHRFFDFNWLSLQTWQLSDLQNESFRHVSISLCNRTHASPCGNVSFCVITKNNSIWSSLYTFFEDYNNTVQLTANLTENISTIIRAEVTFKCIEEIGKPEIIEYKDGHLHMAWPTVSACPVQNPDSFKKCMYRNDQSHAINLQTLRHLKYYMASDNKNNTYYLNVCGGTVPRSVCNNETNIAFCKIDANNSSQFLIQVNKPLVVNPKNGLVLEMKAKGNNSVKVLMKVEVICNSSVDQGILKFKSEIETKKDKIFIFELETSQSCVKEPLNCSVVGQENNLYDLTSLSSKDHTIYINKTRYLISVCIPLKERSCSDAAFVCIVQGNTSITLGTLSSGLQVSDDDDDDDDDDDVFISSSGGSLCDRKGFRYRSVIKFKCSKTNEHLILVGVNDCIYTFHWFTSVACPHKIFSGNDCKVRDDLHDSFDFKPLYRDEGYYISTEDGRFDLNVCGNLSKPCNGSKNVGVCLTDNKGEQHVIGNMAISPQNYDGRLSFVLQGKCATRNLSSTVHIIFVCSHRAVVGSSQPEYVVKDDSCSFYFVWRTVIACGELMEHNCSISDDKGNTYDLSPLSNLEYNTVIYSNVSQGYTKYFINVCRTVLIGYNVRCSRNTGICAQNDTQPNRLQSFTGLGQPSELHYNKEKQVLELIYKDGSYCSAGDYFQSRITLVCDENATENTVPELLRNTTCNYEFVWKSNLTCNKGLSEIVDHDCKIYDEYTDVEYNLGSLSNKKHTLRTSSGEIYHLAICGSLNNTNMSGIGFCQETENGCVNLGMGNSHLQLDQGKLFLNYTGGDNCSGNRKKYTTIKFSCDPRDGDPHLESNVNSCGSTVIWSTSLVCFVPCITDDSRKHVNISLLRNNEENYRVRFNGTDYFLNVCQPLISVQGLNCYHGSAVCKAIPVQNNKWANATDLGFPHLKPYVNDKMVVLTYLTESNCSHSMSQNVGSNLNFICDPKVGKGNPILQHIIPDCLYDFVWKTSVVCDDYEIDLADVSSNKLFVGSERDTFIDLQSICKYKNRTVGNYFIILCNSSSILQVQKIENDNKIMYEKTTSILFSYSENSTKFFSSGDECKTHTTERYSAVLNLVCNEKRNLLSILKESACNVEFLWENSAGCIKKNNPRKLTTSHGSTAGIIIGILLAIFSCSLVVCCRTSAHRNWFRRKINLLLNRTHRREYGYTLNRSEMEFLDLSSVESL